MCAKRTKGLGDWLGLIVKAQLLYKQSFPQQRDSKDINYRKTKVNEIEKGRKTINILIIDWNSILL